jgi:hypothetical protein
VVLAEGGVAVTTEAVLLAVDLDVPESAVLTEKRLGEVWHGKPSGCMACRKAADPRFGWLRGGGLFLTGQRRRVCQVLSCRRKSLPVNYTWQGSNLQPSVP